MTDLANFTNQVQAEADDASMDYMYVQDGAVQSYSRSPSSAQALTALKAPWEDRGSDCPPVASQRRRRAWRREHRGGPRVRCRIGQRVVEEFDIDLATAARPRAGTSATNGDEAGPSGQGGQEPTPWPNAANVKYPLIITAAIQFAARAYPAIVDGANVVKGKVQGQPTTRRTPAPSASATT
jgi:hypothetical protein